MVARIAGSMIVSVAVLVGVSLLVSLGVLWLTGGAVTSAVIGTVCGLAAALVLDALSTAEGRAGERPGDRFNDENELHSAGADRQARQDPNKHQGAGPGGTLG
jgi:hypothetical protein